MKEIDGIEVFDIVVDYDDETGFIKNSLVRDPAVGIQRMAFDNITPQKMFFADKTRRNYFMSVSILSDTPIYRETEDGRPFYVRFTSETIRKIVNKMVMDGRQNEVSLYHDDSKELEGIFLVEQFMAEKGRVESPLFNIPDGSLIQTYWVKDDAQYERLLNDENFNGFSIELSSKLKSVFSAVLSEQKMEDEIRAIVFDEDLSDELKELKIKKVLNKN